ncbi:GDP-mannose 4,6-dehydratase [bacterium]|nr:GDP-mannose 4,6-dehydratase [bacterium]
MIVISNAIPERVLITGGAGFIGSHLIDALLSAGRYVTILDNMSNGNQRWLDTVIKNRNLEFIEGDLSDESIILTAMKSQQQVWHLAGNADIPLGFSNTRIDLDSAVYGTRNILEAMVHEGVKEILFASSGSVYGTLAEENVTEKSGPLYPLSMYAAGKIAAEAFIASYANLFGIQSWIFRFGNVLGSRMSRGAIRDFALRLATNPSVLTILGDGTQEKSYFLIDDCIEGMMWLLSNVSFEQEKNVEIYNLGNPKVTSIRTIAANVVKAMGLSNVVFEYTKKKAWPGDQPVVRLDVSKVKTLGWSPKVNSDAAVSRAAEQMVDYLNLGER